MFTAPYWNKELQTQTSFLNAMLKLRIIYKQHVKTDTNLFIDIRLYSDPSIILFLPLSSSIPVP